MSLEDDTGEPVTLLQFCIQRSANSSQEVNISK